MQYTMYEDFADERETINLKVLALDICPSSHHLILTPESQICLD